MSENNKKYLESAEVPYYEHLLFDYLDSFKNSHCIATINKTHIPIRNHVIIFTP